MKKNKVLNAYEAVGVPVYSVLKDRRRTERIIKQVNTNKGSKYIKPSYSELGVYYNSRIVK